MAQFGYLSDPLGGKLPGKGDWPKVSTANAHDRILSALRIWLENHPSPDQPAISIAQMGSFTPQQIVNAVENSTDAGNFFESMIVFAAKEENTTLDSILESFRTEHEPSNGNDQFSIPATRV